MISLNESVLVVVDVQEKLFPLISQKKKLIKNINILLKIFSQLNLPIFISEQYPRGLGKTIPEIEINTKKVIKNEKTTFSCWKNLNFRRNLTRISKKQIIVCGVETHICVFQTCMDLFNNSFEVFVSEDAVNSRNNESHLLGIERMRSKGINVVNSEMVLFELIEDSKHKEFKELSMLIR